MGLPPASDDVPVRRDARQRLHFDIGPQSLSGAVRAFSDVTGQALLVDQTLLAGRESPGVSGDFTAEQALDRLLAGTGLVQHYAADQAFTLIPADTTATAGATHSSDIHEDRQENDAPPDPVAEAYGATLQSAVENHLCRSETTRLGTYRLVMQLWIGAAGTVDKMRLISSSGSAERDAAIQVAMLRLRLEPPPLVMVQPVTILLLPGAASRLPGCTSRSPARDKAA
ncbi:secretin and TonB N-terminal domain-containing protein [Dyella koreensis]|uniref:Secretin and TonB N-terminal domain-containing protein n=1 Tax=Dyella koreensis TaxID=311235 RepID=A0ABW8K8A2_9GAMM